MLKHKSPEDFFKKARENGSEKNKDTLVTGEEVICLVGYGKLVGEDDWCCARDMNGTWTETENSV